MYQVRFKLKRRDGSIKQDIVTDVSGLKRAKEMLKGYFSEVRRAEQGFIYQAEVVDINNESVVFQMVSEFKRLRLDMNMTRKEFSENFGVPESTLLHWETDGLDPEGYTFKMIKVICDNGLYPL